jgi:pyruvate dehydrogenase E2 component (dihydrolipoamide acetyltransferase)
MPESTSISLTRIQKLIGKRMSESKHNKPCFYMQLNADVTDLMSRRPRLKKSSGVKITSNAFLIRALALSAHKYPLVLGILQQTPHGPCVTIPDSINVGFAVNAPHALLVPVIPNAHTKTLADIARCDKDLTEKARSKTLTLQEMQGETIALSNLGAYGIDSFLAIVPPPATTILAAGNVVPTVVPQNGKPTVRKMMSLTLSADARIVTGPYAAAFLRSIRDQLQNPDQLI